MSQPVQSPYLNIHEAALFLKCCETHVYRMARNGTIPSIRIGRSWRFRIADLEQLDTYVVPSDSPKTQDGNHAQGGAV